MDKKRPICLLILIMLLSGCMSSNANYKKAEEHYQKAKEYTSKRDVDNSILHLEKALELGIADKMGASSVYGILGGLYVMKGLKQEAKKYFKLALEKLEEELRFFEKRNHYEMINDTKKTIMRTKEQLKKLED